MADEIKNSPVKSQWMLKLAQILRDTKASDDDGLGATVLNPIRDVLGIDSAADELEHNAYGNGPLQPAMENMGERFPHVKQGRGQSVADLAGIAPVGTASKAIFFPFHKGMQATELAKASYEPMTRALMKDPDLVHGSQNKLWQNFGLAEIPRGKFAMQRGAADGRFMFEVPDAPSSINPKVLDAQGRLTPGSYPLEDILRHPELYKIDPTLGQIPVNVSSAMAPGSGSMRMASTGAPAIDVSTAAGQNGTSKKILLHEAQHAVQSEHGMPRGGNPGAMAISPEQARMMQSILSNGKITDGAMKNAVSKFMSRDEYARYRDLLGEQQSSAVERRSDLHPAIAAGRSPLFDYQDPYSGMQYGTVEGLRQLANKRAGSTQAISPEDIAQLVQQLRKTQ